MLTQKVGPDFLDDIPREFISNGRRGEEAVIDREEMYRHLVANDLLREDEARELEEALTRVARRDLMGVADLRANGLTNPLRNIGVTSFEFENLGAVSAARQHMAISDLGDDDLSDFELNAVPVPVTSSPFRLDRRQAAAGGTRGQSVSTVNVEEHTRSVAEKLEDTLTNGGDVVVGGNSIPGYTNLTARQTVAFNDVEWSSTTALTNAVSDVLDMRTALRDLGYSGPYILYLPSNWDGVIDDDYKAESDRTLRERLLAISGVQEVKVLDALADSNALLVQMTSSVVEAPIGQDITTVTYDLKGGLASRWVVLGVMSFALKIARDASGTNVAGIAHLS